MQNTNISEVIKAIDNLISENNLLVLHQANTASCIDGLWKQFDSTEKKHTFIRNIQLYCDLKNNSLGNDKYSGKTTLIVKDIDQKPVEVWNFDGKKIGFKFL